MRDLIVKHRAYGEGKVCAVEGRRVSVSFGDVVKVFSAERFFEYFTADAETAEALKGEIGAELEAERERERERGRREEEEKREKARLLAEEERRRMEERREAARIYAEERRREEEEKNAEEELACRKELLEKLKSYGFEGFLHTTEFENFRKIVESGYLYSRAELERREISFSDRAMEDIIAKTDDDIKHRVRFYYRFGTPTNFKADYFRPVTLVFDEDLIFDRGVRFSLGNAASYSTVKTHTARMALENPWERVFETGPLEQSKYLPEDEQLRGEVYASIRRLRNAEFLYPEKVPVSRIVKVYFTCDAAKKEAESFCGAALRPKLVSDISKFEFLRWEAR